MNKIKEISRKCYKIHWKNFIFWLVPCSIRTIKIETTLNISHNLSQILRTSFVKIEMTWKRNNFFELWSVTWLLEIVEWISWTRKFTEDRNSFLLGSSNVFSLKPKKSGNRTPTSKSAQKKRKSWSIASLKWIKLSECKTLKHKLLNNNFFYR